MIAISYFVFLWILTAAALDNDSLSGSPFSADDGNGVCANKPHVGCFLQRAALANRASQRMNASSIAQAKVEQHLSMAQSQCEKNFWLTLKTCVKPLDDETTYVVTGDINAMWIRDSSAQMHPYIAVAKKEEKAGKPSTLRPLLEGTLRRQAQFMLTDPYANAFTIDWDSARDGRLARGGYVFTGNYELDDGPYFFRFLATLVEAFPDTTLLHEKPIKDAIRTLLALYKQEQSHAAGESEYQYPKSEPWELPGDEGRGLPVGNTGMVWGAFRPSDDAQKYGYNVPGNLFLAATLEPIVHIANSTWKDHKMAHSALELRDSIIKGVKKFGTKRQEDGTLVYCYEVDGLGGCNLMDDANVPSLLSLPYLDPSGKTFDKTIYGDTRRFILSTSNPWYFEGPAGRGIGSPHTGEGRIWPLAVVMQAMTTDDKSEQDEMLEILAKSGMLERGLTESFVSIDASQVTREWFGWPNSLLAEFMMKQHRCNPSDASLAENIPETGIAPRLPSWEEGETFYNIDAARLRRHGVTLPKAEFYPDYWD